NEGMWESRCAAACAGADSTLQQFSAAAVRDLCRYHARDNTAECFRGCCLLGGGPEPRPSKRWTLQPSDGSVGTNSALAFGLSRGVNRRRRFAHMDQRWHRFPTIGNAISLSNLPAH